VAWLRVAHVQCVYNECADELEAALPKPGEAEAVKLAVYFLIGELPLWEPKCRRWLIGTYTNEHVNHSLFYALQRLDELLPDGDK
jgi:hypothetical protein